MYPRVMKKFDVHTTLPNGRAIVKGEYKDLYPDDSIILRYGGREFNAVVETRVEGGAVARVVLER